MTSHANRPLHGLQDAVGRRAGVGIARDVLQQNREFVAAEPGQQVAGPQFPLHHARRVQQELVARAVAEAFVDQAEPVEAQHQHAEPVVHAPPRQGQSLGYVFRHQRAVGQTGQLVVQGVVNRQRLGPLAA